MWSIKCIEITSYMLVFSISTLKRFGVCEKIKPFYILPYLSPSISTPGDRVGGDRMWWTKKRKQKSKVENRGVAVMCLWTCVTHHDFHSFCASASGCSIISFVSFLLQLHVHQGPLQNTNLYLRDTKAMWY